MGEEKKHHSAGSSHHTGGENKLHEQNHEAMNEAIKHEEHKHEGHKCANDNSCCNSGTNNLGKWKVMAGVLLVLLIVSVFTQGFGLYSKGALSKEEASLKALAFVNGNLMQGGQTAVIKSVDEENNMYTMKLQVGAQEFSTYISKDGQLFFPQGLKIDASAASAGSDGNNPPAPTDVPKTAKPEVELYVFTYCPFGLQMEKAAAPVVKLLGNKVDFKIRQIGAMHGPHEEKEAERQLCINKLYPAKFFDYLTLRCRSSQCS
ncbi:hypothetical protein HYU21_04750 [Candidatus Woesearchaeota archaeon]|nr:hypothetical protein [Candidatus Woesearchaeota archaeon]